VLERGVYGSCGSEFVESDKVIGVPNSMGGDGANLSEEETRGTSQHVELSAFRRPVRT
jgi:hypothetical protein